MLNVIINENWNGDGEIDKCLKYLCISLFNELEKNSLNRDINLSSIIEFAKKEKLLKIDVYTHTPFFILQRAKLIVEYYHYLKITRNIKKQLSEIIHRIEK